MDVLNPGEQMKLQAKRESPPWAQRNMKYNMEYIKMFKEYRTN